VGATLAAAIVGPWRAVLVMTIVLAAQAVLFQDGGIASLGANLVDMAIAAPLAGYGVARLVVRSIRGTRGLAIGAVFGAFAATLAASALTAIWLSLSALFPLAGIMPPMLTAHVAIGVLEAGLTGAVLATLIRWRPDLVSGFDRESSRGIATAASLGLLTAGLVVAAFAAPLASSLPDGLERTAENLGFAGRARVLLPAPFPDYGLPWALPAGIATALVGLLGTLVVAVIAWAVSRRLASPSDAVHR